MSSKFCPFSFFSFYVNKDSAQAGGAHHCVEANCALWDSRYDQCSVKTACENIGTSPQAKKPRAVSDILAKIRSKKKPVESSNAPLTTPAPALVAATASVASAVSTSAEVAASASNTDVIATIEVPTAEVSATKPEPDVKELLIAPSIDVTKLPIVTSSQETDNGPENTS